MSFSTAFSSNAVSICASCGLEKVTRVEVSRRFVLNGSAAVSADQATKFASLVSHPSCPNSRTCSSRGRRCDPPIASSIAPMGSFFEP